MKEQAGQEAAGHIEAFILHVRERLDLSVVAMAVATFGVEGMNAIVQDETNKCFDRMLDVKKPLDGMIKLDKQDAEVTIRNIGERLLDAVFNS